MLLIQDLQRRTICRHVRGEFPSPTQQFWYHTSSRIIWWDLDLLRQTEKNRASYGSMKKVDWLQQFQARAQGVPEPFLFLRRRASDVPWSSYRGSDIRFQHPSDLSNSYKSSFQSAPPCSAPTHPHPLLPTLTIPRNFLLLSSSSPPRQPLFLF